MAKRILKQALRACGVGWAILATVGAAQAQISPQVNPGAIQNENRRLQQRLEQQQQTPQLQGPAVTGTPPSGPQLPLPQGVTFLLNGVEFDRSAFLSQASLDAVARQYVGQQVDFAALKRLVAAVNQLYQQKGIITASAVLPPQKIRGGIVHIALVEGKLGKVDLQGNAYTDKDFVLDRLHLEPGKVVNVPQLTDDVTYFNRTNEDQLRAVLQPGASFGLTDLELALEEPRRNILDLFADNEGVEATDRNEGGIFFRRNGILGWGDQATLYGTFSRGDINGSLSYSVPFNIWGGRIGVSYTRNRISIVEGPFESLDITGTAQTGAINLTQPVLVRQGWLVALDGSLSATEAKTDQAGFMVTNDLTYKSTVGFTVSETGAGHSFSISPNMSLAHNHSGVIDEGRYFRLFNGTANALVGLWQGFSVSALAAWQYSPQKLLPADQLFQIGGPITVRGYEANALAGDDGYSATVELHHGLDFVLKALDGFVFVDNGAVFSTSPPMRSITSAGLGWSWTYNQAVTAEMTAGFPLYRAIPDQPDYRLYARLVFHIL